MDKSLVKSGIIHRKYIAGGESFTFADQMQYGERHASACRYDVIHESRNVL